ncbi:MAG: ASCH domain-containing protein [Planctomycetia bacterium]|nr:ASCH domain-containing protein [Planctomycetia bacterium]
MDSGIIRPRLALSIRQPHVEAILRGIKVHEYRNSPTRLRERIYIYSARKRCSPDEERFWLREYGFEPDPTFRPEDLLRGVLVATALITDCTPGGRYGAAWSWHLSEIERLTPPLFPTGRPQPVFFAPF